MKEELQHDPDNWLLLVRLGTYSFLNRDMSGAEEAFIKSFEHAPTDEDKRLCLWRLCMVYGMTGESEKYFETLNRLIGTKEVSPTEIGTSLLQWFYGKRGDDLTEVLDQIINKFENDLASGTIDIYGCCVLNNAYWSKISQQRCGKNLEIKEITPEIAIVIAEYSKKRSKVLEKLCELKPGFPLFQLELAEAYMSAGELDKSIRTAEEVKTLEPNNENVYRVLMDLYFKKAYAERKISVEKAKESAQKAKESGQFLLTILQDKRQIQSIQGQLEQIERVFFKNQLKTRVRRRTKTRVRRHITDSKD